MNSRLPQLTGWLAYATSFVWFIGLIGHVAIYASGSVVPVTHSHSIVVESLGAVVFLGWSLYAVAVYQLLKTRASRLARGGLALGIIAMPYLGLLELLFALEVVWFSDTIALSIVGYIAGGIWGVTVLLLTRGAQGRTQETRPARALRTLLSIVIYPPWPVLIWGRIRSRLSGRTGSESLQPDLA